MVNTFLLIPVTIAAISDIDWLIPKRRNEHAICNLIMIILGVAYRLDDGCGLYDAFPFFMFRLKYITSKGSIINGVSWLKLSGGN